MEKYVDRLVKIGISKMQAEALVQAVYKETDIRYDYHNTQTHTNQVPALYNEEFRCQRVADQLLRKKDYQSHLSKHADNCIKTARELQKRNESVFANIVSQYQSIDKSLSDFGQKHRRSCNDAETSLESEMATERRKMNDIIRNMDDKVKTIPYYMDRKVEKVTKILSRVKFFAKYMPPILAAIGALVLFFPGK